MDDTSLTRFLAPSWHCGPAAWRSHGPRLLDDWANQHVCLMLVGRRSKCGRCDGCDGLPQCLSLSTSTSEAPVTARLLVYPVDDPFFCLSVPLLRSSKLGVSCVLYCVRHVRCVPRPMLIKSLCSLLLNLLVCSQNTYPAVSHPHL